jgi:hypothetical protein
MEIPVPPPLPVPPAPPEPVDPLGALDPVELLGALWEASPLALAATVAAIPVAVATA